VSRLEDAGGHGAPMATREREVSAAMVAMPDIIRKVWARRKGNVLARVDVLEHAAAALRAGRLDPRLHAEAYSEAHKLAGAVGTFGFARASELALDAERMLGREEPLSRHEGAWLATVVAEMREELERSSDPVGVA
jgi:hypothetical protein